MVEKVPFTERSPQPERGLISMRKANDRSILSRAPLDMACTKNKGFVIESERYCNLCSGLPRGTASNKFPSNKGSQLSSVLSARGS